MTAAAVVVAVLLAVLYTYTLSVVVQRKLLRCRRVNHHATASRVRPASTFRAHTSRPVTKPQVRGPRHPPPRQGRAAPA
jgi:hypothetical protein